MEELYSRSEKKRRAKDIESLAQELFTLLCQASLPARVSDENVEENDRLAVVISVRMLHRSPVEFCRGLFPIRRPT